MNQPLVSICIPTYNGEQFIAEAMESAIAQTYPNLEIIVSDDDSIDATLNIIKSFSAKTTIPIHTYHHVPKGIGANWNHCIKNANGIFIKFLFQDDMLLPNCISKMVEVLNNHPKAGIVGCKRDFIIEEAYLNKSTKKWIETYKDLQNTSNLPIINELQLVDKSLFKFDSFFDSPRNKVGEPSTVMFRKALIESVGYFREDLKQLLDYEFYYRILKHYKIVILQEKLVKFRLHNQQATVLNKNNDQEDYLAFDRMIYDDYLWYLNKNMRIYYLKKYNRFARFFFKIVKKGKSIL